MRNTLYQKFVTVCNNRDWVEYSFYYLLPFYYLHNIFNFTQPRQCFIRCVKVNKYGVFRSIYPKLNTQTRYFLKKYEMLQNFIFGWLSLNHKWIYCFILNFSECYKRTNSSWWGGRGPYPSTAFSESTLPGCYPGNSLLCHSLKYPKLIWPHTVRILLGSLH